jgi:hypothetical protein
MSIQIPNLHTSNKSAVKASAEVFIRRRQGGSQSGVFTVKGALSFDPATDTYPTGTMTISVDLSDSAKGIFVATTVEQLDTTGRATPTAYATGRCKADIGDRGLGCRYWIMFADNKQVREEQTPDVISFLVYDRNGKRVAYGTGPVAKGDVAVAPTAE